MEEQITNISLEILHNDLQGIALELKRISSMLLSANILLAGFIVYRLMIGRD